MRNIYAECVVQTTANPLYKGAKMLLTTLLGVSVMTIVLVGLIGTPFAVLFCFLLYKVTAKTNGEYEYIHTNNCLEVYIVVSGSRRKKLCEVDLDRVLLVVKVDSQEAQTHGSLPEKNYSGTNDPQLQYAVIYSSGGNKRQLLIQPNDVFLNSLKLWLRDKVKEK